MYELCVWENWSFCMQQKALTLQWNQNELGNLRLLLKNQPAERWGILKIFQTTYYYPYSGNI